MTKEENISYISLRSTECRFPEDELIIIKNALSKLEDKDFDHLKRISETEFRKWCNETCNDN